MATNAKIEALELKLKQAKEAQKAKDARIKAAAAKKARSDDTRRKILLGSFALAKLQGNAMGFSLGGESFAGWLTREDDKALFVKQTEKLD